MYQPKDHGRNENPKATRRMLIRLVGVGLMVVAAAALALNPFIAHATVLPMESVDTIGALRNAQIFSPTQTAEVLGYYAPGDGGGGVFYWDPNATDPDNGGTVIQSNQSMTGRWRRVVEGWLSVKWFGAKGDGVTDDTQAFTNAFNQAGTIIVPAGYTFNIASAITLPNKDVTILGYGATISVGSASGAFIHTNHGKLVRLYGLTFTGSGPALVVNMTPSGTQYYEFDVQDCRFLQNNTTYGISLTGGREGTIRNSYFETNKGIYRTTTANTDVIGNVWKNTTYCVFDDGGGSANSAGLKVLGGSALGAGTCIWSRSTDFLSVIGMMIDYVDAPVLIEGVDTFRLQGNWIASRTTTASVTIRSDSVTGENPRSGTLIGNHIQGYNTSGNTFTGVVLTNPQDISLIGNTITFYTARGIDISGTISGDLKINDNVIYNRATFGLSGINVGTAGDSTVKIFNNTFNSGQCPTNFTFAQVRANTNCGTENQGETTALAGATSLAISHGLFITPTKSMIQVTPTADPGPGVRYWISAVDATNFTISFSAPLLANTGWAWHISKQP